MYIVNVEGAIRKSDKWLVIERSKKEEHAGGMLSLVGGKVSIEDSSSDILESTLKREIFEEVGVKVKERINYVQSTSFITDTGKNVVNVTFLCEYHSGEAFPKSPDEVQKVLWLTTDEILGLPNAPFYLKDSVERAELFLQNTR